MAKKLKKELGILGCGAQSRYILDILKDTNFKGRIKIIDPFGKGPKKVYGFKVFRLRKINEIKKFLKNEKINSLALAISDNKKKLNFLNFLLKDFDFPSLIHPKAWISPSAEIGKACVINPFVYLGPNAALKRGCFIHSLSNIDHDCVLGECVNVSPGVSLAGRVKVGKAAYIYTGASIKPDITIGAEAVVGAGSIVVKNVSSKCVVAGNPAKKIKNV